MPKRAEFNAAAQFQKIPDASRVTGLSRTDLRSGCKTGRYPHIRRGRDYFLNVPALMELLDRESRAGISAAPQ